MKRTWQSWPLLLAILLFGIAHPSYAWSDDDPLASKMRSTIGRGLKFIQEDAVKWRNEKTCSTCHHGSMTMWVQLEARSRGFEFSDAILEENVKWAKQRILERVDLPRDNRPGWNMVNTPAIYWHSRHTQSRRKKSSLRMIFSGLVVICSGIRKTTGLGCGRLLRRRTFPRRSLNRMKWRLGSPGSHWPHLRHLPRRTLRLTAPVCHALRLG